MKYWKIFLFCLFCSSCIYEGADSSFVICRESVKLPYEFYKPLPNVFENQEEFKARVEKYILNFETGIVQYGIDSFYNSLLYSDSNKNKLDFENLKISRMGEPINRKLAFQYYIDSLGCEELIYLDTYSRIDFTKCKNVIECD